MDRLSLAMTAFAGVVSLIAFVTLLGTQVIAQQQMAPAEHHHPNSDSSNQSGISSTSEELQNTTRAGSGMMMNNQISNVNSTSLVDGVKVSGISIIDNEHIAINLRYDGGGEPPAVSVVVAITNSSYSDTTIDSIMQNSSATSADNNNNNNSSMQVMRSGSNYLEAGWQVQHPNSATVLVQLDGNIAEGGHIMVIALPFLHH